MVTSSPRSRWQTIILIFLMFTITDCGSMLRNEDVPMYRHEYRHGTVNGRSLDWTIGIPYSYEEGTPAPLILSLHFGGTPTEYYGATFTSTLVLPALHELDAIILSPTCPVDRDHPLPDLSGGSRLEGRCHGGSRTGSDR